MVLSLQVPSIQRFRARKRNAASGGAPLTALMVAKSAGVFTPLSGGGAWRGVATAVGMVSSRAAADRGLYR